MRRFHVVSDGTPSGTELRDDQGNVMLCSKLTWTIDGFSRAKLVIEVEGAAIDAYGEIDSVTITPAPASSDPQSPSD